MYTTQSVCTSEQDMVVRRVDIVSYESSLYTSIFCIHLVVHQLYPRSSKVYHMSIWVKYNSVTTENGQWTIFIFLESVTEYVLNNKSL